jgi:hypothetical protein
MLCFASQTSLIIILIPSEMEDTDDDDHEVDYMRKLYYDYTPFSTLINLLNINSVCQVLLFK